MARDNFSAPVKALLARRVAFRCSFPDCPAYTIGPAEDSEEAASVGEAAHITAASPEGPRFDGSMKADERSSSSNGMWMCRYHGRLVDADDSSFTVDQLRAWKFGAEQRARERLVLPGLGGKPTLNLDLADFGPAGEVNEPVGTILERSGIATVWGQSEHGCLQDLFIEIARNALEHGGASRVGVVVEPYQLTLLDDGVAFDPLRTLAAGDDSSGGRIAVRNLARLHGLDLLPTYRRHGELNELCVMRVEGLPRESQHLFPCTRVLGLQEARRTHFAAKGLDVASVDGCVDVVVVLPVFMSLSDAHIIAMLLRASFPGSAPQLHLVLQKSSENTVAHMKTILPNARFLRLT